MLGIQYFVGYVGFNALLLRLGESGTESMRAKYIGSYEHYKVRHRVLLPLDAVPDCLLHISLICYVSWCCAVAVGAGQVCWPKLFYVGFTNYHFLPIQVGGFLPHRTPKG